MSELESKIKSLVGDDTSEFNYAHQLFVKRRPYVDRFLAGEPSPPFEVEIQPTSRCNLACQWCIGHAIQRQRNVLRLPDFIKRDNIQQVVDGILACEYDGLRIDTVKFSGFIGEPLLVWDTIEPVIHRLLGAGLRVGVFTNGILMGEQTWRTLRHVAYVHVSLDAGPCTFGPLRHPAGVDAYRTVLHNIADLRAACDSTDSPRINAGFIVVPWNVCEIEQATKDAKTAGADSIRFKVDISGQHDLVKAKVLDRAFGAIARARNISADGTFGVHVIHEYGTVEKRRYASWDKSAGCPYQHFCTTVGSDGNLYVCDFNTMPGAVALGNVINQPFQTVWDSEQRRYVAQGIQETCQSPVCPPFGKAVNDLMLRVTDRQQEKAPTDGTG